MSDEWQGRWKLSRPYGFKIFSVRSGSWGKMVSRSQPRRFEQRAANPGGVTSVSPPQHQVITGAVSQNIRDSKKWLLEGTAASAALWVGSFSGVQWGTQ